MDHNDFVNGVMFSPNGLFIATETSSGDAKLWDLTSKRAITVVKGGFVNRLAFSPDGRTLATAEGSFSVEDFGSGDQAQGSTEDNIEADKPGHPPSKLGKKILGVRLWDVATGESSVFLPHKKPVGNVLFSPDGTFIASSSREDTVQLWNATTGEHIASLQVPPGLYDVDVKTFSPDGKYLAAETGNEVLIWEVGTRQEMTPLMHDGGVEDVIFSADGRYLAASNGNQKSNQISIWDWKRGREIARLRHGDRVNKVIFTPDDSRLVSASNDGMVRVWAWQKEDLVADACSRLEWNLSPDEWRKYLGDKPQACPSLPVPEK